MSNQSIQERVIQIISNQLGRKMEDIKLESSFTGDLDADSLDLVELVMAFENEFSAEIGEDGIPEEDSEKLRTVQDVIHYVEKRMKDRSAKG